MLRSERNQGRAIDMGWLDHDRLGFNYRLTELQAALGIAQVERADELLAARSRVAGMYADALGSIGGKPGRRGSRGGLGPAVRRPRGGAALAGSSTRFVSPTS